MYNNTGVRIMRQEKMRDPERIDRITNKLRDEWKT